MRHRKAGSKLNCTASHRDALFRNMVTSLLKYNKIRTTCAKAKELRRLIDKMIGLAKRGDLHARRQALAYIREKSLVHKLFAEAKERFAYTNSGYTRALKIGYRAGDSAPMSLITIIAPQVTLPEKLVESKEKEENVSTDATA
jgi:large subunit ribosomal protein L17